MSDKKQEHILVVEDDEASRQMLERRLLRRGYTVTATAYGEEALDLMNRQDFTAVLLDMMLPDLSGSDVIRLVRDKFHHGALPIIVVSARSEHSDIIHALDIGANDYITKPVDFSVLEARLKNQIELHSNEKDYENLILSLDRLVKKRVCDLEGRGSSDVLGDSGQQETMRLSEGVSDENGTLSLLNHVPAAIYIATQGPERRFRFINSFYRRLTGYDPRRMPDSSGPWKKLIHKDDRKRVLTSISELQGEQEASIRYRVLQSDGKYRLIEDRFSRLGDTDSLVAGVWLELDE